MREFPGKSCCGVNDSLGRNNPGNRLSGKLTVATGLQKRAIPGTEVLAALSMLGPCVRSVQTDACVLVSLLHRERQRYLRACASDVRSDR